MSEGEWRRVSREQDLLEGKPIVVRLGDEEVHLVRLDGLVCAVGNRCPHEACSLSRGNLFGHVAVCPCHNARVDMRTGKAISGPALDDLPVYPVRIDNGEVFLGRAPKPRFPKSDRTDGRVFLIVGAGAAGSAAAETLRREGFGGRVLMITAEPVYPYERPFLSKDFISGIPNPELTWLRDPEFYAHQKIEVVTTMRITSIDPRRRTATMENGQVLSYDKALLATGGIPRRLPIPGADGGGCFHLRSFTDACLINAAATGARHAVIIGAGLIGLEAATSLRRRGLAVSVVAPESLPLENVVGRRIAAFLKKRHEAAGVRFHLGTTVDQISGPVTPKVLVLSDGTRLEADFVLFGLGVQPVVDYLAGTELVEDGGVPVSPLFQTKYAGLFAAGDIAIVPDPLSGTGTRIEHWVVAQRHGQHAARAMLGSMAPYQEVPFFWTRQAGITLQVVGVARNWDEIVYRGEVEKGRFLAGYFRKGRLVAGAAVGMPRELISLQTMIASNRTFSSTWFADESYDFLAEVRPSAVAASNF